MRIGSPRPRRLGGVIVRPADTRWRTATQGACVSLRDVDAAPGLQAPAVLARRGHAPASFAIPCRIGTPFRPRRSRCAIPIPQEVRS